MRRINRLPQLLLVLLFPAGPALGTPLDSGLELRKVSATDSSIVLAWTPPVFPPTAPRHSIEVRSWASLEDFEESQWPGGNLVAAAFPAPIPGGDQLAMITGLAPDTDYYFVVAYLADSASELPMICNEQPFLARTEPPDSVPPAAVPDLAVTDAGEDRVTLTWTATGDDGDTGQAREYDVRISPRPIDPFTFYGATRLLFPPSPGPAGQSEMMLVTGLTPGSVYYVRLKAGDERNNWSETSPMVVAVTTGEAPAPRGSDSEGCGGASGPGGRAAAVLAAAMLLAGRRRSGHSSVMAPSQPH